MTSRRRTTPARSQLEMFAKPQQTRIKRMHVIDCGNANCDGLNGNEQLVSMICHRCGHESDWIIMPDKEAAKKGLPCPICNATATASSTRSHTCDG